MNRIHTTSPPSAARPPGHRPRRRATPSRWWLSFWLVVALLMLGACDDTADSGGDEEPMPSWVESVYPEPGSTAAVPDAVEVDHELPEGTDIDIRLLVDGIDVTTYATFEAGKLRYESGEGPVTMAAGDHTAEVQQVTLPTKGDEYTVVDSFQWEFRTA